MFNTEGPNVIICRFGGDDDNDNVHDWKICVMASVKSVILQRTTDVFALSTPATTASRFHVSLSRTYHGLVDGKLKSHLKYPRAFRNGLWYSTELNTNDVLIVDKFHTDAVPFNGVASTSFEGLPANVFAPNSAPVIFGLV